MTVHAPFRFAPINRWVYFPEWADLVSHDVPFSDGYSGEIELEIVAQTPLLVGGARREASSEREGEVLPFQLGEDGEFVMPNATLQGLTRSVLEVASFAKLGDRVTDKRYGIRDLSAPAAPFYRKHMVGKAKAGFARIDGDRWTITPCELFRIPFGKIPKAPNVAPLWNARTDAPERYKWVAATGPYALTASPDYPDEVARLAPDAKGSAWLVITGNTGTTTKPKLREFVFVEIPGQEPKSPSPEVVADFRFLHENYGDKNSRHWSAAWKHFLETGYGSNGPAKNGGRFPVFYLEDGQDGISHFGLAQMFKLVHSKSPRQLLENSAPAHAFVTPDLPSTIFGSAASSSGAEGGLKRRVFFDFARPAESGEGEPDPTVLAEPISGAVLLSPKPSYFPIYIRQPGALSASQLAIVRQERQKDESLKPVYAPYATYTPLTETDYDEPSPSGDSNQRKAAHERPELAGVKLWPAGAGFPRRVRAPYLTREDTKAVAATLNPLATGARFVTVARFHNLRAVELGAVLWALTFGQTDPKPNEVRLRHRLGMGKPFGLGEVVISVTRLSAIDMNRQTRDDVSCFVRAFENVMQEAYEKAAPGKTWKSSAQVIALKKAATPTADRRAVPPETRRWPTVAPWRVDRSDYMELNPGPRKPGGPPPWNDFQAAKRDGEFLGLYAPEGHEFPKPTAANIASARFDAPRAEAGPSTPRTPGVLLPGDRVRSIKMRNQTGTVVGLDPNDPALVLVRWDQQGGQPQPVGKKRIEPIP